jgi:hypothetical protein
MLIRVSLILALFWIRPGWSQIGSISYEIPTTSASDSRMLIPPPVSSEGYPTTVGSQMRSNYLTAGLILGTAHDDNVLAGTSVTPVGDLIYTFSPTITLNRTTQRQQMTLTYSPGFTLYQHTSTLNVTDQNAAVTFQYRLSQHLTINLSDFFQKSSNVFDQLYSDSGGVITGSSQTTPVAVIAPYADQIRNTANMGLSYQFGRNDMFGASSIFSENDYTTPSEASDFYNSASLGGSAFYSRRLSSTQYVGVTYQYLRSQSNPVTAQTIPLLSAPKVQTHTLLAFYTFYLTPTLSLSVSGGPQYTDATQSPLPPFNTWTPSVTASIGWQRSHTNLAASYSRTVTGGIGLPGAFASNSANVSVLWQLARAWTVGTAGSYFNNDNLTPSFTLTTPGGQAVSGTISVRHSMSEQLTMEGGYAHLRQSYSAIPVISADPDSNRWFISISYQLTRLMGQ